MTFELQGSKGNGNLGEKTTTAWEIVEEGAGRGEGKVRGWGQTKTGYNLTKKKTSLNLQV